MTIIAEDSPEYLFDVKEICKLPEPQERQIDVGVFAESKLATAAIGRGYVAWWPMGHAQKADVCLWKPPSRPVTVQVKNAQWKGHKERGYWQCYVASKRGGASNLRGGDAYRKYATGDFDVLAMYVPAANAFKFWRLTDISGQLCLSITDLSTLNNWHVIEDALKA
jgi:hypothetical protein